MNDPVIRRVPVRGSVACGLSPPRTGTNRPPQNPNQ